MAITRDNLRTRVILLFLAAALTAWGGAAAIPACADTSDWIWVTGGMLQQKRFLPTATLVDLQKVGEGKGVLLVGGGNETTDPLNPFSKNVVPLDTSEFYRVGQTKTSWRPSLNQPRLLHTATLLTSEPNDGKVLVVAGLSSVPLETGIPGKQPRFYKTSNTCELFDPKNPEEGWKETQCLSNSRFAHTTTPLTTGPDKGKLMVAGGLHLDAKFDFSKISYCWSPTEWDKCIIEITLSLQSLASCELYDPNTGDWDNATSHSLHASRALHTTTLLTTGPNEGKVLVTGGVQGEAELEAKLKLGEVLHGRTDNATVIKEMDFSKFRTLKSCELYDPATGQWDNATSLRHSRVLHTATLLKGKGKVLVAGGQEGAGSNSTILRSYELYDLKTGEWTCSEPKKVLPFPSSQHTDTLLTAGPDQGKVLLVGGTDPYAALLYDPKEDSWTLANDWPAYPRAGHTATVLNDDGGIWVAGGVPSLCELYRPPSALLQRLAPERLKARLRGD